ncbi:SRPBCC family protein [Luteimonas saliphila]|uniref:SRPBCC family protein n=1 Tax=Luteimonas saliphila TaxID=2804919 RepID=UPI00192DDE54|nr:SRPBCC family protein [Luteimonas saliphila]
MSVRPTGRVFPTAAGADLVIERSFHAPIEDVWASVSEPDRLARWFGRWSGEAGPGKYVMLQLGFEKDASPCRVLIESCRPPAHLAVCMKDDHGDWRLELTLEQRGDTTQLRFVQHLTDPGLVGDTGPGWEYYLDMLIAAHGGQPLPDFANYYPAQREYFASQIVA